ncbi:MAG TPA: DUF169 domain-containing protein, partial [bacterium]|nr:DUF169 domain-containing protein [bacterium]
ADHHNCPIGSHTHNIPLPANRAHELSDVLGTMSKIGYLKMEEVPKIPVWNDSPGAVVYARLADAPVKPDVVMFATRPGAAMLLGEAAQAAGCAAPHEPLGRPTCMSIPAAAKGGATMSTGCIGNRVYTDLPDTHAYMALRGADLEKVAASLETILSANETLSGYHRDRKARLTRAS